MHLSQLVAGGIDYMNSSSFFNGATNLVPDRMHLSKLVAEGVDHMNSSSFFNEATNILPDRSLFVQVQAWALKPAYQFGDWLKQPHVLALIMAFWITFTVVLLLLLAVGFNVPGVGAATAETGQGTLAAAFQAWAYGGFTPAGGVFATLTSMAMLGILMPIQVGLAAFLAGVVTLIVWACGVGL